MQRLILLSACLALADASGSQEAVRAPSTNPLIAEADGHYARRQSGRLGAVADGREIALAISGYDSAARAPDSAEARWKLARALYFRGAYTGLDGASQVAVFDKARRVGDEAVRIVERRARRPVPFLGKDDSDAVPSYFWAAVAWGQWALASGKVAAAKTGAAEKVRDYATAVIGMDPEFEDGGGYRVLGRLHDQAPWIPFLTGWVSREDAVGNLRLAMRVEPRSLINQLFLAEALWSGDAAEKAEAIRLAEAVTSSAPSPARLVEELKIQEDARADLKKWKPAP